MHNQPYTAGEGSSCSQVMALTHEARSQGTSYRTVLFHVDRSRGLEIFRLHLSTT